jgi:hypothetical protein
LEGRPEVELNGLTEEQEVLHDDRLIQAIERPYLCDRLFRGEISDQDQRGVSGEAQKEEQQRGHADQEDDQLTKSVPDLAQCVAPVAHFGG